MYLRMPVLLRVFGLVLHFSFWHAGKVSAFSCPLEEIWFMTFEKLRAEVENMIRSQTCFFSVHA